MTFTDEEIELITCALALMAESDEDNGHAALVLKTRALIARFENEAGNGD